MVFPGFSPVSVENVVCGVLICAFNSESRGRGSNLNNRLYAPGRGLSSVSLDLGVVELKGPKNNKLSVRVFFPTASSLPSPPSHRNVCGQGFKIWANVMLSPPPPP